MMRHETMTSVAVILILAASLLGCQSSPDNPPVQAEDRIPVRLASVPAIVEAPSHVAYQNGYFADEGLELTIEINPDGKTSLERLFEGQVDIAGVMGTPIVYNSFDRDDFYILGKIDHAKIHWVVARQDHGISSAESLKGKRVAVMLGTSGHFFMDSWLIYHGLKPSDLQVLDMNGPAAMDALVEGTIDAMFCWFPFPKMAERDLGENAIVLPSDNLVPGSWVIVARKAYVHENPRVVTRFLRALVRAEAFIAEDPDAARAIHAAIGGVDEALLATVFDDMGFNLAIDQALLLDLEDQARWMMNYGYVDGLEVPNYLEVLYPDALREVKPDAVTVISE